MNQFSTMLDNTDVAAHVLCIDQFSSLGGGQRSLLDLLPAFSQRGWRPSVAIPGDGRPFLAMLERRGYPTHTFTCGSYASKKKPITQLLKYALELPRLVNSLAELVEENKPDLVYVNGPRLVPPAA